MYMKLSVILLSIASLIVWSKLTYSASPSPSGEQEQRDLAVLLHNRIVGVPAQGEILQKMVDLLKKGKAQEAALLATEHPFFYDLKLRALFTPWSNREGSVSIPLNDMVMTMIGMVRDNQPFDKVLSADLLYERSTIAVSCEENPQACNKPSRSSLKESLQQLKQSEKEDGALSAPDKHAGISGVLSTTAFAEAFYRAGTNRRATAFVLKNFLCQEMEQLHDIETAKDWVRQDVSRKPGGDSKLFYQRCVGCHAGMDALSGWSVYYDFPLSWDNHQVREKVRRNVLYQDPDGRNYNLSKNANDSFTNLWTKGKNAKLGWRGKTSGKGAKEFGEMMTRSKAFASCMARQVYESVCYLTPEAGLAKQKSEQLAEQFEKDNYNMRKLFAATAVACLTKKKAKKIQAVEN